MLPFVTPGRRSLWPVSGLSGRAVAAASAPAYDPVTELGTDLIAYWDANRADLITESGGVVSAWSDIVAGYPTAQATVGFRPTYSATSFNGRPGVTFDGTDDCMLSTDAGLLAVLPAGDTPVELWGLADNQVAGITASSPVIISYGSAGGSSRRVGRASASSTSRGLAVGDNAGVVSNLVGSIVEFSGRHYARAIISATDLSLEVDGTADGSQAAVPSTIVSRLRIGASPVSTASGFWLGTIAAALITKPLSAPKAAALGAWLASRR